MRFAIKHKNPSYYLEKGVWNFANELNEKTVYTAEEIARRLVFEDDPTLKQIAHELRIVPLEEAVVWRETR